VLIRRNLGSMVLWDIFLRSWWFMLFLEAVKGLAGDFLLKAEAVAKSPLSRFIGGLNPRYRKESMQQSQGERSERTK
jgi:hypothetical protein